MSKYLMRAMILVAAAVSAVAPLQAQGRSAVSGAELDAAVVAQPAAGRDAVRELLTTPHAQQVAGRMGVSPAELSARVATLDEASLNRLAERARFDDRILAGGDSKIVISTTAIIIGLLILILLVD